MAKKVNFMCTAFRDGFQSVFGMRVLSKDYFPAVEAAKDAGIRYIEAGGGAAFQSAFFYCNENAFDVMDNFRKVAGPDANLQTLARGINVVGLDSMSSDLIKMHAQLFKKHGMTTIRNFDALNDPQNLIFSGKCIVEAGLKHQLVIAMMSLPPGLTGAHDPDFYEQRLRAVMDADVHFDSLAFKDASGTAVPATVHEVLKRARKLLGNDIPITFHTHETAGTGVAASIAALEGGASTLDLSMSPVSGGTCQTDIVTMWHALRGSEFELDVDIDKVMKVEEILKDCLKDYFIPPEAMRVEPTIPWSPMPGGAMTANTQMLRDNGLMDKFPAIIKEMQEVVRKGGYGTSVTPVSQFYFQQAFNNVMSGRWNKIAEGYGKMVLGYFGKTPVAPDAEVVKIAAEQLKMEPTTRSPLEINDENPKKQVSYFRKQLEENNLPITDENIFIAAACGEKGLVFLKGDAKVNVRYKEKETPKKAAVTSGNFDVIVNGKNYKASLEGDSVTVNGKKFDIKVNEAGQATTAPAASSGAVTEVLSPVPGLVVKVLVNDGDQVQEGQPIVTLEVMKMETPVPAPASGKVSKLSIRQGDQLTTGQFILAIG